MGLSVDIQIALGEGSGLMIPGNKQIQQWADRAVSHAGALEKKDMQMTVRIVDEEEITHLNSEYRHKKYATNVLSFPFVTPPGIPEDESMNTLGDLVICASVVKKEAEEQQKSETAHWAHMIIHGTLHLLGFDHQNEQEAKDMEALETAVLSEFGIENPYE